MKGQFLYLLILASVSSAVAFAAEESVQPYIDQIKSQMKDKETAPSDTSTNGSVSPYIDSIKAKVGTDDATGYTEQLKEKLGPENGGKTTSYTEDEKQKLGPGDQESAIAQVKEGRSELKYEKRGKIQNAFGLRFGVGLTRDATAPEIGTGRAFNDLYGHNYAPDIAFYYERQFIRSDVGTFSLFGMAEVGIFQGYGVFEIQPQNPADNSKFSSQSQTLFHFIEVPGVVGASYRFQLSKYVQPFAMAGPALAGFIEQRNDGIGGHQALSKGYYWNIGVAFQMDWFNKAEDFDRYDTYSIKHTYLNAEYSQFHTVSSPIDMDVTGPALGVTFEF